jgi:hypothetical protein
VSSRAYKYKKWLAGRIYEPGDMERKNLLELTIETAEKLKG